jgi:hypothetical protein
MQRKLVSVLGAAVALLCVLAFLATCAAWILLDAHLTLPFLDKAVGVELLLTCGSAFLVLCIIAFLLYISCRRTQRV